MDERSDDHRATVIRLAVNDPSVENIYRLKIPSLDLTIDLLPLFKEMSEASIDNILLALKEL